MVLWQGKEQWMSCLSRGKKNSVYEIKIKMRFFP